jgi:hypothetical protein
LLLEVVIRLRFHKNPSIGSKPPTVQKPALEEAIVRSTAKDELGRLIFAGTSKLGI